MAGAKLTASEAYERGLVTRVYPRAEFKQKLTEASQHIASLPPMVCMCTLCDVNEACECKHQGYTAHCVYAERL